MGHQHANHDQTDIHKRVAQLGREIKALKKAVAIAATEADTDRRERWLRLVAEVAEVAEENHAAIEADLPPDERPQLRLIIGDLSLSVSALAAAAHRQSATHPAVTTAVAVAAGIGAVLYIGTSGTPPQATTGPRPTRLGHQRRDPLAPRAINSQAPAVNPTPSPTPRTTPTPRRPTVAATNRPLLTGRLVPLSPSLPPVLPPVSPSPADQHPTCVRFALRPVVGLRVCP